MHEDAHPVRARLGGAFFSSRFWGLGREPATAAKKRPFFCLFETRTLSCKERGNGDPLCPRRQTSLILKTTPSIKSPAPTTHKKTQQEFRRANFNTESLETTLSLIDFGIRIVNKSGLSPEATYLPAALHPAHNEPHGILRTDLDSAMIECRATVTGAVGQVLARNGLSPKDIDVLITTCSIFCPTPSMASMVVNAFGLPKDIQAYHLGGMGCGNGVVVMGLVKDLLKARPGARILLVTTEVTTPAYYVGKDYHRQVTNMLFRMGAGAMLFSSSPVVLPRGGGGAAAGKLLAALPRPLSLPLATVLSPLGLAPKVLKAKYRLS